MGGGEGRTAMPSARYSVGLLLVLWYFISACTAVVDNEAAPPLAAIEFDDVVGSGIGAQSKGPFALWDDRGRKQDVPLCCNQSMGFNAELFSKVENIEETNVPNLPYYKTARPFWVSLVVAPQRLLGINTKTQTFQIDFTRAMSWYDWRAVCPYQCVGALENSTVSHAWTYEGRSRGFNVNKPDLNVPCMSYLDSEFSTPGTTHERFSQTMWVPDVVPQGQISQVLPRATILYDNVMTLKGFATLRDGNIRIIKKNPATGQLSLVGGDFYNVRFESHGCSAYIPQFLRLTKMRLTLKTKMDFRLFPFDTQILRMKFRVDPGPFSIDVLNLTQRVWLAESPNEALNPSSYFEDLKTTGVGGFSVTSLDHQSSYTVDTLLGDPEDNGVALYFASDEVDIHVSRWSQPWLSTSIFYIALNSIVVCFVPWVARTPGNLKGVRPSLMILLFLTTSVQRNGIIARLPTVKYPTFMDNLYSALIAIYIFGLCVILVQTSFDAQADAIDSMLRIWFPSIVAVVWLFAYIFSFVSEAGGIAFFICTGGFITLGSAAFGYRKYMAAKRKTESENSGL